MTTMHPRGNGVDHNPRPPHRQRPVLYSEREQRLADALKDKNSVEIALAYSALDLAIFRTDIRNDHPLQKWSTDAMRHADDVREIFGQRKYRNILQGIAAATGERSDIIVIDADFGHKNGADGVANFKALCQRHDYDLARVPTARTPRDGRHYIFADRRGIGIGAGTLRDENGELLPGIDWRGEGGMVPLPAGQKWRTWAQLAGLENPPELPNFLYECLLDAQKKPRKQKNAEPRERRRQRDERTDSRWPDLHPYVATALSRELDELRHADDGQRNDQLNRSVFAIAQFIPSDDIDEDLLRDEFTTVADQIGLLDEDERRKTEATLDSAITAGMQCPRDIPDAADDVVDDEDAGDGNESDTIQLIDPSGWKGKQVPERKSLVEGVIPANTVTLLIGDGGVGKSILAMMLLAARSASKNWLGLTTEPGRSIYFSCEDDRDEMHRRLDAIKEHYRIEWSDLKDIRLIDMVGEDAVLGKLGRGGKIDGTTLLEELEDEIVRFKSSLLILDASADVFAGDESSRAQVRQFITLLKGIARKHSCTIVLLAHPSLAGIASGRGTSGSTAWNNSCRSRLYFETAKDKDGTDIADGDGFGVRTLTVKKINYGKPGAEYAVRWDAGCWANVYKPDDSDAKQRAEVEKVFIELLELFLEQGQRVSHNKGPTYAPARFAEHEKGRKIKKQELVLAMQRLLDDRRITINKEGPPSHRREYLTLPGKLW
jgi:RecA-family ATPase